MTGRVSVLSLVIPVYKNEENLDRLLNELVKLSARNRNGVEVVFVVDGSPDRSYEVLRQRLPGTALRSQLLSLSRNFGSFAAISAGLASAQGDYYAVIAADLQEPPELVEEFFSILIEDRADLVFGTRRSRSDSFLNDLFSKIFWSLYRRFIVKDIPSGGIDVFGCNRLVRDRILEFPESSSNLVALLFWIGYRRAYVAYDRRPRTEGKSAWTFKKKLQYCLDSIFNFTDLPIQLLLYLGSICLVVACLAATVVITAKLLGDIPIPGYTPIVLAILFFGSFTSLGLGIVGQYLWLTLQNTRRRPNFIVHHAVEYTPFVANPDNDDKRSESASG